MNLSRLALLCAALVGAWLVQVIGIFQFQTAMISGPPQFHIVDFDNWQQEDQKLEVNKTYTSQESADRQLADFHREKWLWFLAAIAGTLVTFMTANLVFETKSLAACAVVAGPLSVAYYVARSFWR